MIEIGDITISEHHSSSYELTLTNPRVYEYDSPLTIVSRILKLRGGKERNRRIFDKSRSVNDTISALSLYFRITFYQTRVSDRH